MAVNLSPYGGVGAQFLDNSGNVLTGGKIFTYAAGTTTNQVTYTTSAGNIPHSNPIILDASGRVPSGGEIWLTDGLSYKFILRDANDVLIATYDNVTGINSNFIAFTNEQEIQTATAGQTVFNLTTTTYQPGTNSLSVFVDGVNQYGPGAQYAYLETDSDTVTFVTGLHVGAEVKFTTSQLNSSGLQANAFQVSYTPPFTNSVGTNVGNKLAQTISVKDFGAVGDGVTDDTVAIQNAINYSTNYQIILGVSGENYRITAPLTFNIKSFNGNGCTITKDFAGTGIVVTGGAAYSYLKDFTILASVTYAASDYNASGTEHGINVLGTRVEIFDVTSNGHDGAGFMMDQSAGGNMNKCKLIRIAAGSNALAGCYMKGDYPTTDNMSVWEFNGRFQSNYGYGIYSADNSGLRQIDAWIYSESNFTGASAPVGQGAVYFGFLSGARIWAYVEQQLVGVELVLGANASSNTVQSVRNNADEDQNGANLWYWASGQLTTPVSFNVRQVTLPGFRGLLPRVATSGEYLRVPLTGSGGNFGFLEGRGFASPSQQIRLLSADASKFVGVDNDGGVLSSSTIAGSRLTDSLITGSGHFIRAGSGSISPSSTVTVDLIDNSANFYYGKLTCLITSTGASAGDVTLYEVDFTYNGTTLSTSANSLNAAVAQYTAALSLVGSVITLSVSYTSGLGATGRYSYRVDVVGRSK
jgi:hypothetical protein